MSGRLPWWLFVSLGWVVIFVVAIAYWFIAVFLGLVAAQMYPLVRIGFFLLLLGGAVVTLFLSIAIGDRMNSIACAHRGGCAFTIVTPLLLLLSLLLLLLLLWPFLLKLFFVLIFWWDLASRFAPFIVR